MEGMQLGTLNAAVQGRRCVSNLSLMNGFTSTLTETLVAPPKSLLGPTVQGMERACLLQGLHFIAGCAAGGAPGERSRILRVRKRFRQIVRGQSGRGRGGSGRRRRGFGLR